MIEDIVSALGDKRIKRVEQQMVGTSTDLVNSKMEGEIFVL